MVCAGRSPVPRQEESEEMRVKRSSSILRRAGAFAMAVCMGVSILPGAFAAAAAPESTAFAVQENSVDALGNVDLEDEVFEVPDAPADRAEEEETLPEAAADGDYDDLISLQTDLISQEQEQKLIDLSGHKDHTPRIDADNWKSGQDSTCSEQGWDIYQCTYTMDYTYKPSKYLPTITVTLRCHKDAPAVPRALLPHTQPANWDDPADWEYIKKPTCEEPGERVMLCTVCKQPIESTKEPVPSLGGTHNWVEDMTRHVDNTCTENGRQVFVCTICGDEHTVTLTAPGHKWGAYQDDKAAGCQVQTQSQYCLVCKARNTETTITTGDAVRKHKFTHYVTVTETRTHTVDLWGAKLDLPVPTPVVKASCDYGCSEEDALDAFDYPGYAALAQAASDASESLALSAVDMIQNALEATRTAVQNASTREEAIASLDQIYTATRSQLLAKGGVDVEIHLNINGKIPDDYWIFAGQTYNIPLYNGTVTIPITEEMADSVLGQLKAVIDNAKSMLQESFLSMDAVQVSVTKITDTVLADCADPNGMQKSLHELAFYPVYKSAAEVMKIGLRQDWDKSPTDSSKSSMGELILRLAGSAVNDDDGWKPFVDVIIDNVADMLVDYVRNDEKYGKYLHNKLGEELLSEMHELVKQEIADDTTFVNGVRSILGTALDNAAAGVRKGWSDDTVLANLRTDLLKVNDLVEQELLLLGDKLGGLVDTTLQEKFKKWLPFGDLTAWIGRWVGGLASDLVKDEIAGEKNSVRNTIEGYIKYITCGEHDYQRVQTKAPTCAEDGEKKWRCSKCGWTRSDDKEILPKLGHIVVVDEAVEPTETTDGLTEGSHCIRPGCGITLVPQEVVLALQPQMERKLLCSSIPADLAASMGYKNTQKMNEAIDAALTRAGYSAADSQRYFVQVETNLDILRSEQEHELGEEITRILPNDRYPEDGVTGWVERPAGTAEEKQYTWYAVQLLTVDAHGYSAGDVIVTPVTQTEKGLQITVYAQAVVALAWQQAE